MSIVRSCRRWLAWLAMLALLCAAPLSHAAEARVLLVVGDSISAGYG
jgi:hypothetical protein